MLKRVVIRDGGSHQRFSILLTINDDTGSKLLQKLTEAHSTPVLTF